eukprot:1834564-Prorocentrum_lima.AAC.1
MGGRDRAGTGGEAAAREKTHTQNTQLLGGRSGRKEKHALLYHSAQKQGQVSLTSTPGKRIGRSSSPT